VALLYGPAWIDSAWVLALLFLCLPAWTCWGLSTPVLWNSNRRQYEFLLPLPLLAVAAPLWWLLAPEGIRAVAMVSVLVIVARAIVIVGAALRALKLGWLAVLPNAVRGLGLAAVCAAAVLAGQQAVAGLALPGISLCAGGTCALIAMLLMMSFRPQILGRDVGNALASLFPAVRMRWALPLVPDTPDGQPR
jgi:lipopolysaccharide exporter